MKCDKCSAEAVIYQKYSGMNLCKAHFQEDVNRKIRGSLRESGIFSHGAKIAMAVNGSADSALLIYVLKSLFSNRKDIELAAIMVDEGIIGYRLHALDCATKQADELHVPFFVRSFKDAFGVTIDGKHNTKETCSSCKSMRNELLNRTANEIGADALAIARNLDEEAAEIMLGYLRGDIEGISDMDRVGKLDRCPCNTGEWIPIIKPLRRIPEEEARLYASGIGLPFASTPCPYISGLAMDVKKELKGFEARHPGTNYSLLRSLERIAELLPLRDEEGQSL